MAASYPDSVKEWVDKQNFIDDCFASDINAAYHEIVAIEEELINAKYIKTSRFVIGTSTAGWTEKDCDYLCDGVDDQVKINNAIQSLPSTGGEIIILDGIYNITNKININKSNVSIRGNCNATILKRMYDNSETEGIITLTEVTGCNIENLQINGNRTIYRSTSNDNIFLYLSSNNTIINNISNDSSSTSTCLNLSNNNIIMYNTHNNNEADILITVDSKNNIITCNICNNNNYGITLSSSDNNTVTSNVCMFSNNRGIKIEASNNNTITGNTCKNNSYGIFISLDSNNNTVTGNACNDNNYGGIIINSGSNNTIIGNTCIRGTGTPDNYTSNQYTIRLYGTSNNYNLISSNNCMGKAVKIDDGAYNTVFNNKWNESDDINDIKSNIAAINKVITTTIGVSWLGSVAPYTQEITGLTGITSDSTPIISPVYSADNVTAIDQKVAWNLIGKIVTGQDKITITCFTQKPTTAIPIQIKGV